jgi:NAD(P)-dependent dehydrogenase (short-subunit alcohol dehydrogenase family)
VSPDVDGARIDLGLAGKRAVVTGGAAGIGLGIARRLVSHGAYVVVVDRDDEALRGMADQGLVPVHADLADGRTAQLAHDLVREHGPLELVVNNVGVTTPAGFLDLDEEDFDLVFRTNLRGPWFLTRTLVRHLIDTGMPGSVLFVSSVHQSHLRLNPHYSASKAAVAMLVRELAYELAPHRIRVNSVSPGWIRTRPPDPEAEASLLARIPVGRPGEPDDVARQAVTLLSDAWSAYVTGADLVVDGGLGLHSWLMDR